MSLNKMNLFGDKKELSLNEFLQQNKNILVESGFNWCRLYQVTEEQVQTLGEIFKREGFRYDRYEKSFGVEGHLAHVVSLRGWFNVPEKFPGRREKHRLMQQLEEYKASGKFSGIAPEAYDELIDRLKQVPDAADIEGYSLRYHY